MRLLFAFRKACASILILVRQKLAEGRHYESGIAFVRLDLDIVLVQELCI